MSNYSEFAKLAGHKKLPAKERALVSLREGHSGDASRRPKKLSKEQSKRRTANWPKGRKMTHEETQKFLGDNSNR